MKVADLRIGNFLKYEEFTMEVCLVGKDCVHVMFPGNEGDTWEFDDLDDLEPIPLTEEWLSKFGFKENKNCDEPTYELELKTGMRDRLTLSIQPETFDSKASTGLLIEGGSQSKWLLPNEPWIYVHQLQNLYHALTGNELSIWQVNQ